MKKITFTTSGVCSSEIIIDMDMDTGIIESIHFEKGCSGNLQGISRLVTGMTAGEVIKKLKGIDCKGKGTSCPDQLSKALEEMLEKSKDNIA